MMAGGAAASTSGPAGLLGWPAEPVTLGVMLAVFLALSVWRAWPIGIALVVAAWAGAAANGIYLPVHHLIEGAFSYLDPILVIATAMIFMRVLADGGALAAAGSLIERSFSSRPAALLPLVMLIVMFPGMITGSSTASVLTTGAMAAPMLIGLGLAPARAAALIAMGGVLGMVAPPVNIPAMLIGGGIDLPYVGFDGPLALAAFPTALVVCYGLGWPLLRGGGRPAPQRLPMTETAPTPLRPLPLWRIGVPILICFVLMVAPRVWPVWCPDPGLPLTFLTAAAVGILVLPRFAVVESAERAVREALPVLGILTGVGGFIQVMTLTGGRGWIVSVMLGAPSWALLAAAAVSLPLFGAVSAFGSASVLGVPFLLALLGRGEVVTTSGLSLLAGLGDLMLPAAVAATLAAQMAGIGDRRRVLAKCLLPALLSIAVAVLMLVYSPVIARWMR